MSLPAVLQGNLSLPVICSPLFIISNPDLVIAQCKAGVVGSFPALNARPAEVLDEWLQRITSELADYKAANPDAVVAPFAVNQIVHSSNDRLQHDVELCVKYKVPIIITSLRAPNEVVGPIHSYGGLVFHDVINVKHAKKAIEAGVDGLILVCAGAGGHAPGKANPCRCPGVYRYRVWSAAFRPRGAVTARGKPLANLGCAGAALFGGWPVVRLGSHALAPTPSGKPGGKPGGS